MTMSDRDARLLSEAQPLYQEVIAMPTWWYDLMLWMDTSTVPLWLAFIVVLVVIAASVAGRSDRGS